MKNRTRSLAALAGLLLLTPFLAGCGEDTATTSAQCGFVVGDGSDGEDAKVHEVYYPNQKVKVGDYEDFLPIPCNSRNWIDNPKGSVDANGNSIGDFHVAMKGVTSEGTKVEVWLSMFWTPNQTKSVMMNQFYPFCEKYDCFSNSEKQVNNSSSGWNDMLGENVPGAMSQTVRDVIPKYGDTIWTKNAEWQEISDKISAGFGANFSAATGFGNDLLCGSGDVSGWDDPNKPGEGKYECGAVRIRVDDIVNADGAQQKLSEQTSKKTLQMTANKDRFDLAKQLYGNNAGAVLGNLDLIAACKSSGGTCVVTIGEGSTPTVVTPSAK